MEKPPTQIQFAQNEERNGGWHIGDVGPSAPRFVGREVGTGVHPPIRGEGRSTWEQLCGPHTTAWNLCFRASLIGRNFIIVIKFCKKFIIQERL